MFHCILTAILVTAPIFAHASETICEFEHTSILDSKVKYTATLNGQNGDCAVVRQNFGNKTTLQSSGLTHHGCYQEFARFIASNGTGFESVGITGKFLATFLNDSTGSLKIGWQSFVIPVDFFEGGTEIATHFEVQWSCVQKP